MTRTELVDKIKGLIKKVYNEKPSTKDENSPSAYLEKFEILNKFPQLDQELIKLMTGQYGEFLKDIDWVAPRPTTFRVKLNNNQYFYMIFGEKSWTAQIEGKKYWLMSLPEEERAAEALARILRYGGEKKEEDKEVAKEPETPETPAPETPTEPEGVEVSPEEFEA